MIRNYIIIWIWIQCWMRHIHMKHLKENILIYKKPELQMPIYNNNNNKALYNSLLIIFLNFKFIYFENY